VVVRGLRLVESLPLLGGRFPPFSQHIGGHFISPRFRPARVCPGRGSGPFYVSQYTIPYPI